MMSETKAKAKLRGTMTLHTAVTCCLSSFDIHRSRVKMLQTLKSCKAKLSKDAAATLERIERASDPVRALILVAIAVCEQVEQDISNHGGLVVYPDGSTPNAPAP